MSPLIDGQVVRDKDGFFRDERGLLSMPHLTAFMASMTGAIVAAAGLVAFFLHYDDAFGLIQVALGLVGAGVGLEGWQTHIESRNQRDGQR